MLLRADIRHPVVEEKSIYLVAVGFIAKVYSSAPSFEKNSESYSVDFLRDNNYWKKFALYVWISRDVRHQVTENRKVGRPGNALVHQGLKKK